MKVVRFTGILAVALAALAASCMSDNNGGNGNVGQTGTGVALTVDILGDTDVAGFRYVIERDRCAGDTADPDPLVITQDVDLNDVVLPGGSVGENDFEPGSRHLMADFFVVVPAGCYDVTVLPLTAGGSLSGDCGSASMEDVVVREELTTEIMLISQCDAPKNGALDTIVALNHQPLIENLEFIPSKFIFECEALTICVTASDPDNDGLAIDWHLVSGRPLWSGPTPIRDTASGADDMGGGSSPATGQVRECVQLSAKDPGTRELVVTVRDLMRDEHGTLVPIEDVTGEDSSASLRFPIHVMPDLAFQCFDEDSGDLVRGPGQREPVLAAGCTPKLTAEELICSLPADQRAEFCPGGEADLGAFFGICD
jgi:hypothetical protein